MDEASDTSGRRHATTGRWQLGLGLIAITVLLWSTVPIALSLLLDQMDATTITWYRFVVGAAVLGVFLRLTNALPDIRLLVSRQWLWLLVIAGIGITGNFVLYLYALNFIPPGASQVIMNLAPLFVLLGSVLLFREAFLPIQCIGLVVLIIGLLLFFHERVHEFTSNLTNYAFGAMVVMSAAVVWASYALAQKQLLKVCRSSGIMLTLYSFGVVILFPFCTLNQIGNLSTEQYVVLAYSSANTLIAYGCFAEALQHLEASRASTIVCITPLLTLALSYPAHAIWPDRIMLDEINSVGLLGALLVVIGSMLVALAGRQRTVSVKGVSAR